jgi:hypothetical protein
MEAGNARHEFDLVVGDNPQILPLAVPEIGHKHVIAEDIAEAQAGKIYLRLAGFAYLLNGNIVRCIDDFLHKTKAWR